MHWDLNDEWDSVTWSWSRGWGNSLGKGLEVGRVGGDTGCGRNLGYVKRAGGAGGQGGQPWPGLLSAPSHPWLCQPFALPSSPGQNGQEACWAHVCQVLAARLVRARLQGLPALRGWGGLVLVIYTDKRDCCDGKGLHWGSIGLGTWARKEREE